MIQGRIKSHFIIAPFPSFVTGRLQQELEMRSQALLLLKVEDSQLFPNISPSPSFLFLVNTCHIPPTGIVECSVVEYYSSQVPLVGRRIKGNMTADNAPRRLMSQWSITDLAPAQISRVDYSTTGMCSTVLNKKPSLSLKKKPLLEILLTKSN